MAHDIATTIWSMAKSIEEQDDASYFQMTLDIHLDGQHKVRKYDYRVVKTPLNVTISSASKPSTRYTVKTSGLTMVDLNAFFTLIWREAIKLRFQEAYKDNPEVKRAHMLVGFKVNDAKGIQHMLEMTQTTFTEVMVEGRFADFDNMLATLSLACSPFISINA